MKRGIGVGLAALLAATTLSAALVAPAQASSKGRRNTALVLGAAAVYELLNHNTTAGVLAGAGAAYAYKRYSDERDRERRWDRWGRGRYDRDRYYSDRNYRRDGDWRASRYRDGDRDDYYAPRSVDYRRNDYRRDDADRDNSYGRTRHYRD
jgi:hypothetical protein